MTMSSCHCAMMVLTVVSFAVPENTQQALCTTAPGNTHVKLNVACLRVNQCVLQINGINYRVLEQSTLPILSDIPCCKEDCISDNQTCLCCDKRVNYLQAILQGYSETEIEYWKVVCDRASGIEIQKTNITNRYELSLKLQVCSEVCCSNKKLQKCELIQCKPNCEQTITATPSSTTTTTTTPLSTTTTTKRPTSTTTTPTTSTTTTTPTTTTPPTTATTPSTITAFKTRTSEPTTMKTRHSTTIDDNGQNQTISPTRTSNSSNMKNADAFSAKQNSPNVAAVVLGVVLSLLVAVAVTVFLIFYWRRRRAKKGGKAPSSPSTIAFVTEAETGESEYAALSSSVGYRQNVDKKTSGALQKRESEYEHEYSVIPADAVKFTHPNDLDAGYDVLRDVTSRKLPPALALDDEYSLARNPDGEMKKKLPLPSGSKPGVISVAKTTTTLDLKGKDNAEGGRKEKEGQYFVLEKDKDDYDDAEKKDRKYFILEANADGEKEPEAGGQYFVLEKEKTDEKAETGGQYFVLEKEKTEEKAETGGQYFVLEKENANEKPEYGGEYFVLEKDAAGGNAKLETGGQYFVLEKDDAGGNEKQETGGQYFVLEKDDANEKPETGGQYFVLEKDTSDASGQDQTGGNALYSSLNRDDMQPVDGAEQDSEYTALNNTGAGTAAAGSQKSVVPQYESEYSLQKPVD